MLMLAGCFLSNAAAIDVSYTVSGSPGAWDLNFTVTNNMTAWPGQDIYQFGVLVSAPGVTGSPVGYDPTVYASWTNFFMGGSGYLYNNIWYDGNDFNHLLPGTSLSGFVVTVADTVAPVSVPWFAFSVPSSFDPSAIYTGTDAFNISSDFLTAGFEGAATPNSASTDPTAAPEPAAVTLLALGLGACGVLRRHRG
jgi:hypothetical protein